MSARKHKKKTLVLLLEGLLLTGAILADDACYCPKPEACAPCVDQGLDEAGQRCAQVKGKRLDRGDSLTARGVPGPNAERELGGETYVLSDAPRTAVAPVAARAPTPPRSEIRKVREETRTPVAVTLAEPLFASGGSELTPAMKAKLDDLATQLAGKENLFLTIIGHTDDQSMSAASKRRYGDNHGLGLARARAAAEYLATALKLHPAQITLDSKGPDQPVADNATPEGMAQNRRIEIQARYEMVKVSERQEVVELPPLPVVAPPPPAAPTPLRTCQDVLASRQRAEPAPFRISIDGVPQNDTGTVDPDVQRCTDVALEQGDLQLRYDPLEQTPVLNAHAWPNAMARGETVEIATYCNYLAFVDKAEIRVFAAGDSTQGKPLAVLPVQAGGMAAWTAPRDSRKRVQYLLRVYDKAGRFDETRPKTLDIADQARPTADIQARERELLAGYGENSLALANIPVRGGAVTANGTGIQPGEVVRFLGAPVPVDAKGAFAARQILPAGPHVIRVAVENSRGETHRAYARNLSIAADDWFYLGIADLTLGRNHTTGPAKLVTADVTDHFDNQVYLDGRLAFYLKGKLKGEALKDWLLTASADTRERPLKDLFTNFDSKDPRYLLTRLDPEKYYPVYGDDSTAIDDAPTQGKFFVRLEKGQGPDSSQVMWGSFQTAFTGTEFANYNRALYGGRARLATDATTHYGEKRGKVEVFAADPGTLQSREEFRGTGGSLYYLRHLDITAGSEQVWVEVRDKDTGLVLQTQTLVAAQDYEVNYLQGRVTLREALASTAGAGTLVSVGSHSGHPVHLVVSYDYVPGTSTTSEMSVGGRASVWVNDHLQLGGTALRQDGQTQRLKGVDATLRFKPGTYLKIEGARSSGVGTGAWASLDGGFSFSAVPGGTGAKADAKRVEVAVDFADIGNAKGKATFYWRDREADFSAPGQLTPEPITQQGGSLAWQVGEGTELLAKLDQKEATSQDSQVAEVNLSQVINPTWKVGVGLRHDDLDTVVANASPTLSRNGARTDAVLRMDYTPDAKEKADWAAYGYLQGTVHRDDTRDANNRVGLGGEKRINDRFKLGGELSDGNGGLGAKLAGTWNVDDRTSLYTHYALTTDRTDDGYRGRSGMFTTGGRTRFTDTVSVFGEERYQHGEGPSGLVHAFGLDLSPNDRWTYGLKLEAGDLSDPITGDLSRRAVGLSAGYRKDDTRYAGALEYRHEKGAASRDTWLMKNTLGYQVNPDWRFLGRLNFSISESDAGDIQDGRYLEIVSGWAWRPVANDRWNTLFKYTYYYNLPSPGQVDTRGAMLDFAQKSHVLSVDTIYDVKPWVSVGGKLGVRRGELKDTKVGGDWQDSTAWLGILRADWHWVHNWDVLTELRWLEAVDAEDSQTGALLAVYRHVGKHFKVGGGYNFTDFSDDLTDQSYRSKGWFINLIGKF
jgi:outer membrane protein OmpA-like peptidoglycan-associated protein